MDLAELQAIVEDLRVEGSDFAEVEVKRAAGGFPQSLAPTLSAFGNTPGGGMLIFGLDEDQGFGAVGVYDVKGCQSALAGAARQSVSPPVTFEAQHLVLEAADLIVATIHEVPSSGKPCRVRSSGKAYLRAYDGDYELSQVEEQAFLANRDTPRFDQAVVSEATIDDLDRALVAAYVASCQASSESLNRFGDEEILFRTGVTAGASRTPTVAGLLALGIHPQQFFPNIVIQASVAADAGDPVGTRAADSRRFDGPIPLMLEQAMRWVRRNTRTRVRFLADGHGRDEPEYPMEAVRELLSNALVHRDLGPHALAEAITLKLDAGELLVSNPGGLWGLTVDRLGKTGVTSARNGWLARICQNVRFGTDQRVVEALASGIPIVLSSLRAAGMVPPRFHDQGIRFTVRVPNHTLLASEDLEWLATLPQSMRLSDQQRHALVAMRHGVEWTNKTLREAFPMDSRDARETLAALVRAGVAEPVGERGGRVYRLAGDLRQPGGTASNAAAPSPSAGAAPGRGGPRTRNSRERNAELVEAALARGPASLAELAATTGLSQRQVRYAAEKLRAVNRIELEGGRGKSTSRYRLVDPPSPK